MLISGGISLMAVLLWREEGGGRSTDGGPTQNTPTWVCGCPRVQLIEHLYTLWTNSPFGGQKSNALKKHKVTLPLLDTLLYDIPHINAIDSLDSSQGANLKACL